PELSEIREYVQYQLTNTVWEEEQRFENPHTHYLDLSTNLYNIKEEMLRIKK
ncbi:MAG: nicotinate phosphoribosyltransferase, partial [Lachnospiraceae bacterium]